MTLRRRTHRVASSDAAVIVFTDEWTQHWPAFTAPIDFSDDDDSSSTGASIPYADENNTNDVMEVDRKSPAPAEEKPADDEDENEDEEDEDDVLVPHLSCLLRIID